MMAFLAACLYTKGFERPSQRMAHFYAHVVREKDTVAASEIEYVLMADAFFGRMGQMRCCSRRGGRDTIAYDEGTNEFIIVSFSMHIRTYYRPDPRVHKCATNLRYFETRCRDVKC